MIYLGRTPLPCEVEMERHWDWRLHVDGILNESAFNTFLILSGPGTRYIRPSPFASYPLNVGNLAAKADHLNLPHYGVIEGRDVFLP